MANVNDKRLHHRISQDRGQCATRQSGHEENYGGDGTSALKQDVVVMRSGLICSRPISNSWFERTLIKLGILEVLEPEVGCRSYCTC